MLLFHIKIISILQLPHYQTLDDFFIQFHSLARDQVVMVVVVVVMMEQHSSFPVPTNLIIYTHTCCF
jgi:hypothetical protein